MSIDNFQTEVCQHMLLYPRSVKEDQCRKLKLSIDDTESIKYYMCPSFAESESCRKMFSNFSTSRCSCGKRMDKVILSREEGQVVGNSGNDVDGLFLNNHTSFIITDDLKVEPNSSTLFLSMLKNLGYAEFDELGELLVNVGFEEVLTLLKCLFSSDAPLSDMFLRKQSSRHMASTHKLRCLHVQENRDETQSYKKITLSVVFRRQDRKIGYVECGDDFIDLLLTFLVVPLESVWDICGSDIVNGCIGNLCKSFKGFSFKEKTEASTSNCVLPWYYICRSQLLDITIQQPLMLSVCINLGQVDRKYFLTRCYNSCHPHVGYVSMVDPRSHGVHLSKSSRGFVRRNSKFMVSDNLIIRPFNPTSAICLMKDLQIHLDDVEVQEISISKYEAVSLLRASLSTSSVLSTAFGSLFAKRSPKMKSECQI